MEEGANRVRLVLSVARLALDRRRQYRRILRRVSPWPVFAVLAILSMHAASAGSVHAAREFEKVATIGAQILKLPVGARASAMGGAFTAIADDASCVFWNVGGLARIQDGVLAVNHAPWLADISFSQVTYVGHTRFLPGTFALHARSVYMPEMDVRTVFRPQGDGTSFDAGEMALGLDYARSLTDKFSAGVGASFIQSTLASYGGNAVTFDFGTLYDTGYRNVRIGMQIQNIGSDLTYIEKPVKVPTSFRVGMSTRLLDRGGQRLVTAGGVLHTRRTTPNGPTSVGSIRSASFVFLRGGWYYRFDTERFALGGGLRLPGVIAREGRFDYAYTEIERSPDGTPFQRRASVLDPRRRLPCRRGLTVSPRPRCCRAAFAAARSTRKAFSTIDERPKPANSAFVTSRCSLGNGPRPGSTRPVKTRSRIRCLVIVCSTRPASHIEPTLTRKRAGRAAGPSIAPVHPPPRADHRQP